MKKLWVLSIVFILNCGVYSFRATNLPPELKRIYIPIVDSQLTGDELAIDVRELFTTALQDQFTRLTRLTLADENNADAVFNGKLTRYSREVDDYDSNEDPIRYKITLVISGELKNLISDETIWQNQSFSSFDYFELDKSKEDLGEQEAVNLLIEKLAKDVVTRSTENW